MSTSKTIQRKIRWIALLIFCFSLAVAACGDTAPVKTPQPGIGLSPTVTAQPSATVPPADTTQASLTGIAATATAKTGTTLAAANSATAGATQAATDTATPLPATPTPGGPVLTQARVVSVTDGDTINISINNGPSTPLRLIGVDAPETKDPNRPVMCFGAEATAKTQEFMIQAGNKVYLEKDVSEKDKYNRLLRYVWFDTPNGQRFMLNEELVRWGFAQASAYPPDVKYQERFTDLTREAREAKRGLWSVCGSFGVPVAAGAPAATSATPAATSQPVVTTAAPQAAPAGVQFASVRGAAPGDYASVSVKTSPGATCSITYTTPKGSASSAQGLNNKTSDSAGNVSWSWRIGTGTAPGTGRVTVRCGGSSATAAITIG